MVYNVRVCGRDIGVGDCVVVAFATETTVASVGLVGWVRRIRCFDELTGEQLKQPEFWIEDNRTGSLAGPIARNEIQMIEEVDGHWLNDKEMREYLGEEAVHILGDPEYPATMEFLQSLRDVGNDPRLEKELSNLLTHRPR